MSKCKNCGEQIEWAQCDGRWVPLEPLSFSSSAGDVSFSFVDANGVLRMDHRDRCGTPVIHVTRLKHKIPPRQAEREGKNGSDA